MDVNDTVVQRLLVAEGCLQLGQVDEAMASLRAALDDARRIVADLLGESQPLATVAARRTLLVADDSPDVRALVRRILRAHDRYDVVAEAGDGNEAIEAARLHQPDIILLDLRMPTVDGLTALPRLLEVVPGVRIGILSGLSAGRLAAATAQAGASGYLEKSDLFRTLVPFLDGLV